MNYRFVINQLGLLLIVLSAILLCVAGWELFDYWWMGTRGENVAAGAMTGSGGIGLVVGGVLSFLGRREARARLGRHEALLLVTCSWLVGAVLCAAPFFLWAKLPGSAEPDSPFHSFVNCYFEAMSGLTTTGATVLSDIEALPRGLLLWRSITHWLGGLGIVVLFVAVLPSLGAGGKRLFQTETPGPVHAGVKPRIRQTARILWIIYVGLSLANILALRIAGMPWFDSVCHALSTVSTGGLSPSNTSIAKYNSPAIDAVCIVFMLLAGMNFVLFFHLAMGRLAVVWRDVEVRVYLALKLAIIVLITANIYGMTTRDVANVEHPGTIGDSVRHAAFTTVALHTGTGFCTANYDTWPFLSKSLLMGLMFIGGCAGSTAGGVKVIRFWILARVLVAELDRVFRPNVVRSMKVGTVVVDPDVRDASIVYVITFMLAVVLGSFAVGLIEVNNPKCDYTTAFTASLATLANVGPGLGGVGARENYGWFSDPSKLVLSALMMLGRLEIFVALVVISPAFWRRT